jgi:hypothetical protein
LEGIRIGLRRCPDVNGPAFPYLAHQSGLRSSDGPTVRKERLMATMVDERAAVRGRWVGPVSLAVLALFIVLGLRIWQSQQATEPTPGVEQAEGFSPEAVRVTNTATLYLHEAFSPEAARIRNHAEPTVREAYSPELMRIANWADASEQDAFSPEVVRMRNTGSSVVDSDRADK